ncbi:radical SAM protein, partial [Candidatus Micrarchaeota archaeon]|nr:radical SAM protein [Candidatus Micrarchaeota archaeon]
MNEINGMGFFYTYKCNALCRHCIYSCSIKRKEKMKPGTVSSQLKELSKAGIKKVFFSGGEPLLYQKEIISLL